MHYSILWIEPFRKLQVIQDPDNSQANHYVVKSCQQIHRIHTIWTGFQGFVVIIVVDRPFADAEKTTSTTTCIEVAGLKK